MKKEREPDIRTWRVNRTTYQQRKDFSEEFKNIMKNDTQGIRKEAYLGMLVAIIVILFFLFINHFGNP